MKELVRKVLTYTIDGQTFFFVAKIMTVSLFVFVHMSVHSSKTTSDNSLRAFRSPEDFL